MANIFKTTDSGGLVGVLRDFALAIRQFFGTKSEMDVVATALTDLDNRKIEASDIPASLPANGGNADTVDGEHASAFAHIGVHNNLTASGNEFTFASNEFSGAIWFNYRTAGGANGNITEYKFGNGKGGELGTAIHSGNYNSYSPTLTGTGASGTWGINVSGNAATASNVAWSGVTNKPPSFTPSSHMHTKSEITDFPSSLPASDVYAWAKASTKPSYSWSEINSRPTNVSAFTNDAGYITASNSKFGYYLPLSGGTITGQLYLTGLEEGSSDVTDNTELLTSYASNNGFSDTNATGKVYRRDAIKVYNYIKGKLDSVYSAIGHTHTTSQIMGFPTSLPANGGNADTVDEYHAADFVLKTNHDEHESVIAQSLTDLDRRIDKAITDISIGNVETVDAGKDAQVVSHVTGNKVVLDFSIPRGEQGDMYELDDEGYDDGSGIVYDYCIASRSWQIIPLEEYKDYQFADLIRVPIPSGKVADLLPDCIEQMNDITLRIGENIITEDYVWSQLHWLLQCSRDSGAVYATKYATHDSDFPSVVDSGYVVQKPPTTIEIVVKYEGGARYVNITIENMYGRAYYFSTDIYHK